MRGRIRKSYIDAEKAYCAASDRGIGFGFWTTYHHSFERTDKMIALEKALDGSKTDEAALIVTLQHLLAKDATNRNYSFNSYFRDKLRRFVGEIPWNNIVKLNKLLVDTIKSIEENPYPAKPAKIGIEISHEEYDPAESKKESANVAIDLLHDEYEPDEIKTKPKM